VTHAEAETESLLASLHTLEVQHAEWQRQLKRDCGPVEDLGGPWQLKQPDDRPHGLDIIGALAGPDNLGADTTSQGNRVVWARLDLTPDRHG